MISFDVKPESAPTSSGSKAQKSTEKEPTLSFSELLKGASEKKDAKVVQNGALVLALGDEEVASKTTSKTKALLALLKNGDKEAFEEGLELNSKLVSGMSATELKTLVANAKEYLKSQILSSEEYKKSEAKELPKTLKGLAELAKKFGVDVSKITMEEVQLKKVELPHAKEVKELVEEVPHAKDKKVKSSSAKETKSESLNDKDVAQFDKVLSTEESKTKETKATPLFKAQTSLEHTTEQFVHTKASGLFKAEDKVVKNRADETLKQLLRGEKPSHDAPVAASVSVATAKILAPSSAADEVKSENTFEKLLNGDKESKSDVVKNTKLDGIGVHKADSFEVKLNEAKQMIRYLSADVKTAIEDYKAPFTRIKVQLNPEKLGEVELTIVQRGKNLHVNISSNSTAINTLAMNATELKTQLNNNGINNATLNFNNSSDNSGANQQQGQKQQEKRAHEEYNYQTKEEQNEEILSSLEIVVPKYI